MSQVNGGHASRIGELTHGLRDYVTWLDPDQQNAQPAAALKRLESESLVDFEIDEKIITFAIGMSYVIYCMARSFLHMTHYDFLCAIRWQIASTVCNRETPRRASLFLDRVALYSMHTIQKNVRCR